MKLSILIPTHNRPELFYRCITSVLNNIPKNVQVIVNNDSQDIQEIIHPQIQYHYKQFEHLSGVYQFLLSKADGEYIYYVEDDDYLVNDFYSFIMPSLNYDIIGGNYYPAWNHNWIIKCASSMNKEFKLNDDVFQLGQFIMKKQLANQFTFPLDSCIHNDYKLVSYVLSLSKSQINIPKVFYYQTTDGGDNISFPESSNYYGV